MWLSLSEVVMFSNAYKFRQIWRRRLRTISRLIGAHVHCVQSPEKRIQRKEMLKNNFLLHVIYKYVDPHMNV